MLMVKMDALTLSEGKYFIGVALFDGVGFFPDGNGMYTPLDIQKGAVISTSKFGFFKKNLLGLDVSGFTEDDIDEYDEKSLKNQTGLSYTRSGLNLVLNFQGAPYSGIGYVFHENHCVKAVEYQYGILATDAEWNKHGVLENLYIGGCVDLYCSWFPDGNYKSAEISMSKNTPNQGVVTHFRLALRFTNDGRLNVLSLEGDFKAINQSILNAYTFPVRSIDELRDYELADSFSFTCNTITRSELFGK